MASITRTCGTIPDKAPRIGFTGTHSTGGLAGFTEVDSMISDGYNVGDVIGQAGGSGAGGIVGDNEGIVEYSHNAGLIQGYDNVGGIVGEIPEDGIVRDSFNTHFVSGRNNVGGVVGRNRFESDNYPSTVLRVYNTGTVEGENNVGGVVGRDEYETSHSFNLGKVHGTGENIGGVVGHKARGLPLEHSYNMGTVTGGSNVGGVVGALSGATLKHTYNVGVVKGSADVGGLAGSVDAGASISMSYYRNDGPESGPDNGNGSGLSADELKQSGTYNLWVDFDLYWSIAEGDYPDLRDTPR